MFEMLKVLREAMAPEAFVSVSPAEALRAAAEQAAQAGRAAGVRLEWRQEGDCRLPLKPALFRRAALALLRFAVQGMPGGGRLSAAAVCGAAGVELTIGGEGAPPPEEERDELFRPFSRVPVGEGGLELYLAGLVFTRLLRGELRLETGKGGGTLFRLRLPFVLSEFFPPGFPRPAALLHWFHGQDRGDTRSPGLGGDEGAGPPHGGRHDGVPAHGARAAGVAAGAGGGEAPPAASRCRWRGRARSGPTRTTWRTCSPTRWAPTTRASGAG